MKSISRKPNPPKLKKPAPKSPTTQSRPPSSASSQQQTPQATNFVTFENASTTAPTNTQFRKRGELMFKCNFESGNLHKVVVTNENEYDLHIRPDTNSGGYHLWFYFSVSNVKKYQRALFTICNFSKTRSLYRQGMTPVVRTDTRPGWERLPEKYCYYYRSNKHNKNYVLSFLFMFDREDDVYYFAYCYPYTYTELQKFLSNVESKELPYFRRELLAFSVLRKRLDLLTITDPSNLTNENYSKKKIVFFTARVHPGETPSSFVMHGLISFLISSHPAAKQLREMLIFKIIPMLNPDGVFLGNYRCCSMGFDLNRQWLNPQPYAHPTILAARKLLIELSKEGEPEVDFFIDIHAHSNAASGFMYMNHMNDKDTQLLFPRLFDYKAKEFSFSDSKTCKDPSKLGTGRRALGEMLQIAKHCYTLEVSFYNYIDSTSAKSIPLTEENYLELGRNMALTFLDYYSVQANSTTNAIRKIIKGN